MVEEGRDSEFVWTGGGSQFWIKVHFAGKTTALNPGLGTKEKLEGEDVVVDEGVARGRLVEEMAATCLLCQRGEGLRREGVGPGLRRSNRGTRVFLQGAVQRVRASMSCRKRTLGMRASTHCSALWLSFCHRLAAVW